MTNSLSSLAFRMPHARFAPVIIGGSFATDNGFLTIGLLTCSDWDNSLELAQQTVKVYPQGRKESIQRIRQFCG